MANYIDIDKLTYTLEKFNHRYVYDLPLQENDTYLEYSTLKTKPYKTITSEDRQRLSDLTNELYDYIFFADDINNYASAVINMQKFISEDFPDYVNEVIGTLWTNYNDAITGINKKKQDIDDWYQTIKTSITISSAWWDFDNWLAMDNGVKYSTPAMSGNTLTEQISLGTTVFATRTTTFGDGNITERIVVTDIYDGTKLYDKTLTTVIDSNCNTTETVKNNL